MDITLNKIHKENEEQQRKERQLLKKKIQQEKRESQRLAAERHCLKMDDLKVVAQGLFTEKKGVVGQLKKAVTCLTSVEEELKRIRKEAMNLRDLNKHIEDEFTRIEASYFDKKAVH